MNFKQNPEMVSRKLPFNQALVSPKKSLCIKKQVLKKVVVLLCFAFALTKASGQETKVVTLDVGKPSSTAFRIGEDTTTWKSLKVKHNALLALQLKNANPYKFTYELNHEVFDVFEEDQADFTEVLGAITTLQSKSGDAATPLEEEKETLNGSMALNKSVDQFGKEAEIKAAMDAQLENLEAQLKLEQKLLNTIITNFGSDTIVQSKTIYKNVEAHQNSIIKGLRLSIASMKVSMTPKKKKKELKQLNATLTMPLEEVSTTIEERQEALLTLGKMQITSHATQHETLALEIEAYLKKVKIEDFLDQVEFQEQRETFLDDAFAITRSINAQTKKFKGLLKTYDVTTYNSFLEQNYTSKAKAVQDLVEEMYAIKLEHYRLPVAFDGKNIDAITLEVKRTLKDKENPSTDTYSYDIWVTGGFKLDVSAGVFLSTIRDRTYTIGELTNNEGTVQVINETNLGDVDYGFGSVANLSYRTGGWVKPTLSFGAMFTNNQKFQLLAGGGLVLGKMARFVLHYGLSVGRAETLQTPFVADGTTAVENLTSDTIPTVEKLQLGHFFGITYNLGKVKSQDDINK